jgi:Zn-dependent M28 family amino/carboxypeptidase
VRAGRLLAALLVFVGAPAALVAAVTQPFVAPVASQAPAVDASRLAVHVRHLSVDLYPRSHDHFDHLEAAAQYILGEFKAMGAQASVQEFPVDELRVKNIVARFGPAQGPVLVVGAHYDSHGDAVEGARHPGGHTRDTHTPGADDNASGVAGLIELGRLLQARPPKQAVELVAYTLEEPPHFRTAHMGSVHHARSLVAARREVRLMLSLEMIGRFSDAPGSQLYPVPGMDLLYTDRADFIAVVGRLGDMAATRRTKALMAGAGTLPVRSINAPTLLQGIDFSDHRSYWAEGFPALMVSDTSFLRNLDYHLAGDTPDRLDYGRMAQVVQAVHAVVRAD